jgi:hypothetical protein
VKHLIGLWMAGNLGKQGGSDLGKIQQRQRNVPTKNAASPSKRDRLASGRGLERAYFRHLARRNKLTPPVIPDVVESWCFFP